jgi:NADH:ubiquinone oxidoreductase subunit E
VVRCIGACGLAPVMTIGDDIYERMKPSKVAEILDRYE